MSQLSFEHILDSLVGVEDSSKLLKLLIEVRKKVDGDRSRAPEFMSKIREKGAFKAIVESLQGSKKTVVNISLSILGNCCLDAKCARDVVSKFGLLSNLNNLLKRFPNEDSINGRIFRIIGNLCQHSDKWGTTIVEKKPQIVIQIVKYLEECEGSEATITMGVRALRVLLNRETLHKLVETHNVLKCIGLLLITHGDLWLQEKKHENILMNIIKLLHEYSRFRFYPSILQMRNTSKGDSIAYLSKILLISPRQVVKIVMNFLKMSILKSDLPVREIFDSFIEVLSKDVLIREFDSTSEDCIKCLCHLLEHPGNRENDRCGDSIPILVKVLQGLTFECGRKFECSLLIISTLNKCKYSSSLINAQIKCHMITVINDKLALILGDVETLNVAHKRQRKRKSDIFEHFQRMKRSCFVEAPKLDENNSSVSEEDEYIDSLYSNSFRYDFSPASSNDSEMGMSSTSGLSPPHSPRSQIIEISESDSDDYSPVCSEADPGDTCNMEDFSTPDLDSNEIPEENDNFTSADIGENQDLKQMKIKFCLEALELLKTYVKIQPPVLQLGSPELLLRLIKSVALYDWPYSSTIFEIVDVIHRVLEFHENLIPLMQSEFIPAVYDLVKTQHTVRCSKCTQFQWINYCIIRKLVKVAESGWGKGDIAHTLLRADGATKQKLVLVIPYIIKNKSILVKLMLNCGGLEILMKLLQDSSHFQNRSIKVLCILASKKLGIPNPKIVTNAAESYTNMIEPSSSTVTFRLDDDSLIVTDRELLSRSSDFFARLLNGDFKESTEDVIALPNVTQKAMRVLIGLITSKMFGLDVDLVTHLEVIGLCDRFLMEECRGFLTDYVERFRLSSESVPVIYNWALESRTNLLRVECIAFALVGDIVDSERFEMFKNLFDLGYTEELVEDIRQLLVRYMTLNQFSESKKKKKRVFYDKYMFRMK